MKEFKQYFRAHLKGNLRALVCIFAAVLVLTFLLGINEQKTSYYNYALEKFITSYHSTLYIPVVFLCILAYVLPVMEFSFFKKRINLDCAYALPISRKAMGMVHYLTGLIILFGAFTASYLLNFILLLRWEPGIFNFLPMIPHYLLCLLLGFCPRIHHYQINEKLFAVTFKCCQFHFHRGNSITKEMSHNWFW